MSSHNGMQEVCRSPEVFRASGTHRGALEAVQKQQQVGFFHLQTQLIISPGNRTVPQVGGLSASRAPLRLVLARTVAKTSFCQCRSNPRPKVPFSCPQSIRLWRLLVRMLLMGSGPFTKWSKAVDGDWSRDEIVRSSWIWQC